MKKIKEIFHSLQGEGYHTGTSVVFIRFSGCNLQCPFCDTTHQGGRMMTDDEIVEEASKYPAEWVIFTGGEPTIQLDSELCAKFKKTGKKLAIETNGTLPVPEEVDFITVSPKFQYCPDAQLWPNLKIDELKVVYTQGMDMSPYETIECGHRFLQPCWEEGDNIKTPEHTAEAIDYIKKHPQWRLSLQTQKILNIP